MNKTAVVLTMLALAAPLAADDYYPHHNFTFGAGAALPHGDLGPLFEDTGGISFGYGYRFHRYFQADIGMDILFGAARVKDFLATDIGDLRIGDREYFVPMGGRAILPLFSGRMLFSGGGGGTYMRYNERVSQPSSYFRVGCPVCTSRSGWGSYAQANLTYFFDRYQHFRVGVNGRVYRGHTEGEPLGNVPGIRTHDKWINIFLELGFSF